MVRIRLGAAMHFTPSAFVGESNGNLPAGKRTIPRTVCGHITYINREHRFFRVTYTLYGYQLRECFKF